MIQMSSDMIAGGVLEKTSKASAIMAMTQNVKRKSGLQAPTMRLTGHSGEIFSVEFSPDGRHLASASYDKTIFLWNVYGDCENFCYFRGHTNAVLEVHWTPDQTKLVTCSADKTVAVWDVEEGKRIKKFTGHTAVVNSCRVNRRGSPLVVSAADDGTTKVWDLRTRKCVVTFEHQYQVLAASFDDTSERIFSCSLDSTIRVYNMTRREEQESLTGHADSITGLDVSNDGNFLLTNSMDHSVRLWDIRPFVASETRCVSMLTGATHNFEKNLLRVKWSPDDKLCSAGSADRMVNIWDMHEYKVMYKLSGHSGSVNDVCFHPKEPIIASGSSDKTIFLGELDDL
eukprot:GHVL01021265.1.p1 GENE.GHVL01021265.1~~GHVL01021265.1.p1  ORF type:complete len:342 (-),score=41.01 GHVL01021265.1:731-1756(-)